MTLTINAIQAPSPPPIRSPSGNTSDAPFGPLANSGMGNPVFYHQWCDDFDNSLQTTSNYTLSGTGSAAHTSADGGQCLLSTTSSAGSFASIQIPVGSFTLPGTGATPPTTSLSVKKMFYLTRIALSDITLSAFVAGLAVLDTTPFTAIADGIWFSKAASSTALILNVAASSGNSPSSAAVSNTITIPTSAYTLTANTTIDLAFYIDRAQNLYAYVNAQLVGYIPQSGSGTAQVAGPPTTPSPGPVGAIIQTYQPYSGNYPNSTPFSTAVMSPILGISNGATAAIKTMTVDFHVVQKER